jgi:hypothetical protein
LLLIFFFDKFAGIAKTRDVIRSLEGGYNDDVLKTIFHRTAIYYFYLTTCLTAFAALPVNSEGFSLEFHTAGSCLAITIKNNNNNNSQMNLLVILKWLRGYLEHHWSDHL